ncbi:MAG: hypothetical protein NZ699_08615 [Roseiflexus sp.]|nr:hypothetical protein [Roseiflexus sp.]MCS7289180.1 hypothetical protein [Roseiflexus sp.]MDW8144777.1 hypothetical protein [Roseiflexaceae bacterium]MDW8232181.1 hypothetical protein [Roseiflexaceae bacterium]
MKTYRLSPSGRRSAIALLIGALLIWVFALWTLRISLATSSDPSASFIHALRENLDRGLTIGQIIPALLMVVLLVATPLTAWGILEELGAQYTLTDAGLHFASFGIALTCPWSSVVGIRRLDDNADEPFDEVALSDDPSTQIRNPLVRWLHRQACGARRLIIYSGLADRDDLLHEIRTRAGLNDAQPAG